MERRIRLCKERGGLIEVSFDSGGISTGERCTPILEVEFELKKGAAAILFALARRVAHDVPMHLSFENKADRGYRLADRTGPPLNREVSRARLFRPRCAPRRHSSESPESAWLTQPTMPSC